MNVNADFSKRVLLHAEAIQWEDTPMPGVQRRRLDRIDTENERVTTIVRYAPDSSFSSHTHTGGEEFIVLEGIFQDDYGDWPAGSYVRNPPQSRHTPSSKPGCTIFVKLWQFQPDDRTFVHCDLSKLGAVAEYGRPGVEVSPLFKDDHEEVRMENWEPGASVTINADGGAEIFVLNGEFTEQHDQLHRHSWLRAPTETTIQAIAGPTGARVWIKTGHLHGL